MRKLLFIALLAAACSYSEEVAQISVTVSNIPAAADHLDVFLCSPAVSPCTADNATRKYRPSFQPGALSPPTIVLALAPVPDGPFNLTVLAFDRTNPTPVAGATPLAAGTVSGTASGAGSTPVSLQVTLK